MPASEFPMQGEGTMREYYAQRAQYYERVYDKPERQSDLALMKQALPSYFVDRDVLEIACGTGYWTPYAASRSKRWLATDINDETMAVARSKPSLIAASQSIVQFQIADAYTLEQLHGQNFDAAFAGCWWSHVPLARLRPWLEVLHQHLLPGAQVVMLDNSYVQTSNLPITRRDSEGNTYQDRQLDDGTVHEVLKNFPTQSEAFAALGPRAYDQQWIEYEHYWMLTYRLI